MTPQGVRNKAADVIGGVAAADGGPPMTSAALWHRLTMWAVMPMARRSGLRGRVGAILDGAANRRAVRSATMAASVVTAMVALLSVAGLRLTVAQTRPVGRNGVSTSPATRLNVDAAALVREVRAAEAWVDRVDSVRIKFADDWSVTPPGHGTVALGFDRTRAYERTERPQTEVLVETEVWDGHRATSYTRFAKPQAAIAMVDGKRVDGDEAYGIMPVAGCVLDDLTFGRAGPHDVWRRAEGRWAGDDYYGRPEEFRLGDPVDFRGVRCWAVACDRTLHTMYVGVDDHRLYGIVTMVVPLAAAVDNLRVQTAVAKQFGKTITAPTEWDRWLATLPAEQRRLAGDEWGRQAGPLAKPQIVQWAADFKEVVPGCWFPMRQGYDTVDPNDPAKPPSGRRAERVTSVVVDQPLPADWFAQDWKEGVPVTDMTQRPPLMYRFEKQLPATDRQAAVDQANRNQALINRMNRRIQSAVGQPAPELPDVWAQGTPVKLADLKGKVTVVGLWATRWQAPNLNDAPALNEYFADSAATGIGILSVHAAGTSVDDIRKAIANCKMAYPVCVDQGGGGEEFAGTVFKAAHVVRVPSAMVIGRDGRIAAVGPLAEVWPVATKLAAAKP